MGGKSESGFEICLGGGNEDDIDNDDVDDLEEEEDDDVGNVERKLQPIRLDFFPVQYLLGFGKPFYLNIPFVPLTAVLKELYQRNPQLMPGYEDNEEIAKRGVAFSKDATVASLPFNFSMVGQMRPQGKHIDRYFVGHPSGSKYRSTKEFEPHIKWLVTDKTRAYHNCECLNCKHVTLTQPRHLYDINGNMIAVKPLEFLEASRAKRALEVREANTAKRGRKGSSGTISTSSSSIVSMASSRSASISRNNKEGSVSERVNYSAEGSPQLDMPHPRNKTIRQPLEFLAADTENAASSPPPPPFSSGTRKRGRPKKSELPSDTPLKGGAVKLEYDSIKTEEDTKSMNSSENTDEDGGNKVVVVLGGSPTNSDDSVDDVDDPMEVDGKGKGKGLDRGNLKTEAKKGVASKGPSSSSSVNLPPPPSYGFGAVKSNSNVGPPTSSVKATPPKLAIVNPRSGQKKNVGPSGQPGNSTLPQRFMSLKDAAKFRGLNEKGKGAVPATMTNVAGILPPHIVAQLKKSKEMEKKVSSTDSNPAGILPPGLVERLKKEKEKEAQGKGSAGVSNPANILPRYVVEQIKKGKQLEKGDVANEKDGMSNPADILPAKFVEQIKKAKEVGGKMPSDSSNPAGILDPGVVEQLKKQKELEKANVGQSEQATKTGTGPASRFVDGGTGRDSRKREFEPTSDNVSGKRARNDSGASLPSGASTNAGTSTRRFGSTVVPPVISTAASVKDTIVIDDGDNIGATVQEKRQEGQRSRPATTIPPGNGRATAAPFMSKPPFLGIGRNGPATSIKLTTAFQGTSGYKTAANQQPPSIAAANCSSWPIMYRVGDVVWVNANLSTVNDLGVVQVVYKRRRGNKDPSSFNGQEDEDVVVNVDFSPLSEDVMLWPGVVRRDLFLDREFDTSETQTAQSHFGRGRPPAAGGRSPQTSVRNSRDVNVHVVQDRVFLVDMEETTANACSDAPRTVKAWAPTVPYSIGDDWNVRVYEVELFGCDVMEPNERKFVVRDVNMTPAAARVFPPEWNPLLDAFIEAEREVHGNNLGRLDPVIISYLKALILFRDHGMSAVNLSGKHESLKTPMPDGVDLKHWSYKSLQWGHEVLNIGDVVRVRRSAVAALSEEVRLPDLAVVGVVPDDQLLIQIVAIDWTEEHPNVMITGIRCHAEDCEDHPETLRPEHVRWVRREFGRPFVLCGVRTPVKGEERVNGGGGSRNVDAIRKQQLVTVKASRGLLGKFYGVFPSIAGCAKLKWIDKVVRNVQDGILPVKDKNGSGNVNGKGKGKERAKASASSKKYDDDDDDGFEQVDLDGEFRAVVGFSFSDPLVRSF
ncbi:hypothetical protein HDU76_010737 [Blyttiomyces sp. JEL0837]|nr:hypothetical protein HDU76_010737 [Blyttiomyces sp. JEL0837]